MVKTFFLLFLFIYVPVINFLCVLGRNLVVYTTKNVDYLSMYLGVFDPSSFPFGWKRRCETSHTCSKPYIRRTL